MYSLALIYEWIFAKHVRCFVDFDDGSSFFVSFGRNHDDVVINLFGLHVEVIIGLVDGVLLRAILFTILHVLLHLFVLFE